MNDCTMAVEEATVTPQGYPERHSLQAPLLAGLSLGAIQAASPLVFQWIEPATLHAMYISLIAAVYIGFAVADGRPTILAVEVAVVSMFVLIAALAVTATAWLLVVGYAGHGLKDYWQHRRQYVANTRWWPPFCAAVDGLVALVLIAEIVVGVNLHQ
jgi:hypothetical protein